MRTPCLIYRCAKQDEMYLYLRADLSLDDVPEALRQRTGRLTEVMKLELTPERRLARADAATVIERLRETGYYLQMPPQAQIKAQLYFGD
ncbi:YcgL domain-containing protein [Solimonas variicoloris]|uniref:YcgL domain-containing protein n=1 Tax=Solimonas variicoloris TaxID=254408 RepID=UPI0005851D8F|nr:YcgL domain-containing protein [Solimonas variicoloris]